VVCDSLARVPLFLFLPLFFGLYYISTNLCPKPDFTLSDPDDVKEACREAWSRASSMSGVAQVCALVAAMPWGLLTEKVPKISVLMCASIVAAIGYGGMIATTDPRRLLTYLWACLLGTAETGLIVSSLALVADTSYVRPEIKGSVAGVYSFLGALGILVTTKAGGELFDIAPKWAWAIGFVTTVIVVVTSAIVLGIWRKPVGLRKAGKEMASPL